MAFSDFLDEIDTGTGSLVGVDRHIVPALLRHTGQDKVYFVAADLDTKVSLGHVKRLREHRVPYDGDPIWVSEVRYSNTLNMCWKRFVCTKELMHAFDSNEEQANTAEKFRQLIEELEIVPPEGASPVRKSEDIALWRAMAALAPARLTGPFDATYRAREIEDYEIALALRIPQFYVPHVMEENFSRIVGILRNL